MPFIIIKSTDIIFNPKVQTYCMNPNFKCPSYGHSWTCPPEAPYLEEKVSSYHKFYLIYVRYDLNKHIKEEKIRNPKRSENEIRNAFFMKEFLRDNLEQEVLNLSKESEALYEQILILWDGFCRLCSNEKDGGCTYDAGYPCRYPDKKRYSMEAIGIDVTQTVRNLGFDIEWPPKDFVYRFGLVCLK